MAESVESHTYAEEFIQGQKVRYITKLSANVSQKYDITVAIFVDDCCRISLTSQTWKFATWSQSEADLSAPEPQ